MSHLSVILWKKASLSLSLLKSKSCGVVDLFCFNFAWNASSESIWLSLHVSSSGFRCLTELEVWNGSLSRWSGNLPGGVCLDSVRGFLNDTFFFNKIGVLLVSCDIIIYINSNQNHSNLLFLLHWRDKTLIPYLKCCLWPYNFVCFQKVKKKNQQWTFAICEIKLNNWQN